MKKLSVEEMENILTKNLIKDCTEYEKKQVYAFAFGEEFMDSDDKGTLKQYEE